MSKYIAVYGTLKGSGRAGDMMDGCLFIGGGVTKETFSMSDVGFPKIRKRKDGYKVRVEVYDSPDWERLDTYEGVPYLYTRSITDVVLDGGKMVQAYIYEALNLSGEPVTPVNNVLDWR